VGHIISSRTRAKIICSSSEAVFVGLAILGGVLAIVGLERFSVDVNRNSKGVPKSAQIRFGLL
jgi:hypothetical protein